MNKRGLIGVIIFVLVIIFAAGIFSTIYFWPEKGNEAMNMNDTEGLEEINDSITQLINETHKICSNNSCVEVEGVGADECSADNDCEPIVESKPDLIISEIDAEVTDEETNNVTNVTTYSVTVSVTVKNIGKADANSSVTKVSFLGFSPKNIFTPAIARGEETVLEDSYEDLEKGKYDVVAIADFQQKIEEMDEDNGSNFFQFWVP